jgi:hypothetical protein
MIAWLNRRLEGRRHEDNETVSRKLGTRCNAEIVARIARRAEIHEQRGGYSSRCSPLDRAAAERIIKLESELALVKGQEPHAFGDEVTRMLSVLREP